MLLQYILRITGLFIYFCQALPSLATIANGNESLIRRAPTGSAAERPVSLLLYFSKDSKSVKPNGLTNFAWHTALMIDSSPEDEVMKIEIMNDGDDWYWQQWLDSRKQAGRLERILPQGMTTLTNDQILNTNGEGPAWDALAADPEYRTGPSNKGKMNTCHNFATRMLNNMGITPSQDAVGWMERYDTEYVAKDETSPVKGLQVVRTGPEKGRPIVLKNFNMNPKAAGSSSCKKRDGACGKPVVSDGNGEVSPNSKNELITLEDQSGMDLSDFQNDATLDIDPNAKLPPDGTIEGVKGVTVGLARTAGTLDSFIMVGKEALGALGVAGTVVGAAFVILDFVGHDWVGGIIGSIGLVAGVVAGFAVSGPVGWIIGGAIAALFAILPGLFKKPIDPAERTDVQGIIQWKMFGDPKHTGNEQCQKGTPGVPGNPDCQALYGSGTLSTALGLNNFDSIVFLQQFNDGYPMTIKDMAANFYVVDETKPGDGGDKMATITCHNKKAVSGGRAGPIGGDNPKWCDGPVFAINRPLIHLPHINDTADHVYNRIIPTANGDCKLVAWPGDQYFQDFNFTLTGLPSAIACGLNNLVNVDGTEIQLNSNQPGGSSGSQSTDGQGGAVVNAPAPTPFKPLAQTDYACIFHGSDGPFCLPPGTYAKQSGLGFEIKDIDFLTLPLSGGWSLTTHWVGVNQDPKIHSQQWKQFTNDWSLINQNYNNLASFHISAPNDGPDPCCCLFTEPSFGGDVWCVGVGGGDILPQWKDKPQSVSCHAGGQVWLYADHYNDEGGALIKGNVEDLKDEPYGADKATFSKNVKALWVLVGS